MKNTGFGFEPYLRLGFEPSVSTRKQLKPLGRFCGSPSRVHSAQAALGH